MGKSQVRVFQRGNRFGIDYSVNQKRYRKMVGTQIQAHKKAKIVEADLFRGIIGLHIREDLSFKTLAEQYIRTKLTEDSEYCKTESSRIKNIIIPHFLDLKISHFYDKRKAQIYFERYSKSRLSMKNNKGAPLSRYSLHVDLKRIRSMFEIFKEWGEIDHNPAKLIKLPKFDKREFRILSLFEIRRLLECAYKHSYDFMYPACLLGLNGLRRGEATHLEYSDLDFDKKIINIKNKYNFRTKNRKNRPAPMLKPFYSYVLDNQNKNGFIVNYQGQAVKEFRRSFKAVKRMANIDQRFRFHDLRHTIASHMVKNGDIKAAQMLLGHSSINITLDIYSHLLPSDVEVALNKVGIDLNQAHFGHVPKIEVLSA